MPGTKPGSKATTIKRMSIATVAAAAFGLMGLTAGLFSSSAQADPVPFVLNNDFTYEMLYQDKDDPIWKTVLVCIHSESLVPDDKDLVLTIDKGIDNRQGIAKNILVGQCLAVVTRRLELVRPDPTSIIIGTFEIVP